jgi:hypothetical protein
VRVCEGVGCGGSLISFVWLCESVQCNKLKRG